MCMDLCGLFVGNISQHRWIGTILGPLGGAWLRAILCDVDLPKAIEFWECGMTYFLVICQLPFASPSWGHLQATVSVGTVLLPDPLGYATPIPKQHRISVLSIFAPWILEVICFIGLSVCSVCCVIHWRSCIASCPLFLSAIRHDGIYVIFAAWFSEWCTNFGMKLGWLFTANGPWQTPPPPIRRPNLADFAEMVCRIFGFLNLADLFCRITRFLGLCRLVLPTCWGFWVLGHLSWRRHLLWDTA